MRTETLEKQVVTFGAVKFLSPFVLVIAAICALYWKASARLDAHDVSVSTIQKHAEKMDNEFGGLKDLIANLSTQLATLSGELKTGALRADRESVLRGEALSSRLETLSSQIADVRRNLDRLSDGKK